MSALAGELGTVERSSDGMYQVCIIASMKIIQDERGVVLRAWLALLMASLLALDGRISDYLLMSCQLAGESRAGEHSIGLRLKPAPDEMEDCG